jgi:hypothetical protein
MKKKHNYMVVLFLNGAKKKVLHKTNNRLNIHEFWRECKTQKRPLYCAEVRGRARTVLNFELALIYPKNRWSPADDKFYKKDGMGRNQPINLNNADEYRVKEVIDWWEPEKIYDFQQKKHIFFEEMFGIIEKITELSQIFTLNNKIFVQIDDDITVYKNKNLKDTSRLFNILRSELLNKKRKNFIFVRDVTSYQRKMLYKLLEGKGFSKNELFRHYSY